MSFFSERRLIHRQRRIFRPFRRERFSATPKTAPQKSKPEVKPEPKEMQDHLTLDQINKEIRTINVRKGVIRKSSDILVASLSPAYKNRLPVTSLLDGRWAEYSKVARTWPKGSDVATLRKKKEIIGILETKLNEQEQAITTEKSAFEDFKKVGALEERFERGPASAGSGIDRVASNDNQPEQLDAVAPLKKRVSETGSGFKDGISNIARKTSDRQIKESATEAVSIYDIYKQQLLDALLDPVATEIFMEKALTEEKYRKYRLKDYAEAVDEIFTQADKHLKNFEGTDQQKNEQLAKDVYTHLLYIRDRFAIQRKMPGLVDTAEDARYFDGMRDGFRDALLHYANNNPDVKPQQEFKELPPLNITEDVDAYSVTVQSGQKLEIRAPEGMRSDYDGTLEKFSNGTRVLVERNRNWYTVRAYFGALKIDIQRSADGKLVITDTPLGVGNIE